VKDGADIAHYSLRDKVVNLVYHTRFTVIDDSAPSGHLTEIEVVRNLQRPAVLLRAHGRPGSAMTLVTSATSKVILELDYDPDNPESTITEATKWAEDTLKTLGIIYDEAYVSWRG